MPAFLHIKNVFCVRWYFNRGDNPAKCWSIDFGPGTPEMLCANVRFSGIDADSRFLSKDQRAGLGPDDPTAWLEAHHVDIHIADAVHPVVEISNPGRAGQPEPQPAPSSQIHVVMPGRYRTPGAAPPDRA